MDKVQVPTIMDRTSTKNQYLSAAVANLMIISFGITEGWASPRVALLTSDESPLPTGAITMDESSSVVSLLCVAGLCGNIFSGFISNKFGRKWPIIFNSIPFAFSWMLVLFAKNIYYLYAARIMAGFFGGGTYVIVSLYLSEVAQDHVRGMIVSSMVLSECTGILIAFILGNFLDFQTIPKIMIGLIVLAAVSYSCLPETPIVLLKNNKIDEAEKSIQFFQSIHGKDKNTIIQSELEKLRNIIEETQSEKGGALKWSELNTAQVRKAFIIGFVMAIINQLSGVFAMLNYTANVFQESGSNLTPNMSAIVVGAILVVGAIISINLVDRLGRKVLLCISLYGCALGLITLGLYMMFKSWGYSVEAINWVPLAAFSFILFFFSLAMLTLPVLVISEIMPQQIRDFGVSTCMGLLWLFYFISTKYLPSFIETLGFYQSMYIFAGVCILCAVFVIFFMPETKGNFQKKL